MRRLIFTAAAIASLAAVPVVTSTSAEAYCRGCWIGAGVAGAVIAGAAIASAPYYRYGYGYAPYGYGYAPGYVGGYGYGAPAYGSDYGYGYGYPPSYYRYGPGAYGTSVLRQERRQDYRELRQGRRDVRRGEFRQDNPVRQQKHSRQERQFNGMGEQPRGTVGVGPRDRSGEMRGSGADRGEGRSSGQGGGGNR